MAAHSFHVLYHAVFQNFYASFKNSASYINTISKMAAGLQPATIRLLNTSATLGCLPRPIMNL